jgi:hypothetical protein
MLLSHMKFLALHYYYMFPHLVMWNYPYNNGDLCVLHFAHQTVTAFQTVQKFKAAEAESQILCVTFSKSSMCSHHFSLQCSRTD